MKIIILTIFLILTTGFASAEQLYTGEKVVLEFYEADISSVFRALKSVSEKNFAIDKDVIGTVTLSLSNPMSWDKILDLVLKMNRLGKVFDGDVIRIATIETLEREAEHKKNKEPLITKYISINYTDAEKILPMVITILTERGSASADKETNIIVITDTFDTVKKVSAIIKALDKVTSQVSIEARIVEASDNFSRELGIQWGGAVSRNSSKLGGVQQVFGTTGFENYAVNLPVAAPTSGIGLNFERLTGMTTLTLHAKLSAMEVQGECKIISTPKITTLNNKTAIIQQGDKIPYPKLTTEGTISVEFIEATLKLEVTPRITDNKRVYLTIIVEKNTPDWNKTVMEVPALATKSTNTELLVDDGEIIVIGGIVKENKVWVESRVPFFGRIPVLGWLFKSKKLMNDKSELLIFITPTIV